MTANREDHMGLDAKPIALENFSSEIKAVHKELPHVLQYVVQLFPYMTLGPRLMHPAECRNLGAERQNLWRNELYKQRSAKNVYGDSSEMAK